MDVPVSHSLIQHSGYISACKFLHRDKEILTASGDGSVVHWDVQTERCLSIMEAHRGDVLCLATSPTDPNVFVSGGSDARLHVWDKRTTGAVPVSYTPISRPPKRTVTREPGTARAARAGGTR